MKKTKMIALKSVKTFPITIDRTERLDSFSAGPSSSRRRSASPTERPWGCAGSFTRSIQTGGCG
jgi:hypothetical protein